MPRLWVMSAASAVLCCVAPLAHAEPMDLALSRLRIVENPSSCINPVPSVDARPFCANQESFERLMSEYGVAMAPPVNRPARTLGPRAFALDIDSTITSIAASNSYWRAGTEGAHSDPNAEYGENKSPDSVMVWNRLRLRTGLPYGFEAGASVAGGMNTSLWTFGLSLKWAIVEGFRSGIGRLPDVALGAEFVRSVGSSQATVQLYAFDLTVSKPYPIDHAVTLSPFAGLQVLVLDVSSGVIDLTPGGLAPRGSSTAVPDPALDATRACVPQPGYQPSSTPPATIVCSGNAEDTVNDVTFRPFVQTRARAFVGGQLRYGLFQVALSLLFDLATPGIAARPVVEGPNRVARQVALNLMLGAVL